MINKAWYLPYLELHTCSEKTLLHIWYVLTFCSLWKRELWPTQSNFRRLTKYSGNILPSNIAKLQMLKLGPNVFTTQKLHISYILTTVRKMSLCYHKQLNCFDITRSWIPFVHENVFSLQPDMCAYILLAWSKTSCDDKMIKCLSTWSNWNLVILK